MRRETVESVPDEAECLFPATNPSKEACRSSQWCVRCQFPSDIYIYIDIGDQNCTIIYSKGGLSVSDVRN